MTYREEDTGKSVEVAWARPSVSFVAFSFQVEMISWKHERVASLKGPIDFGD